MTDKSPAFDEQAFNEFFHANYYALRAFAARRVRPREDVADVLSEVFVVAWRRRDEVPEIGLPWLYGVCSKVISNHRRSARRRLRLWARAVAERPGHGRDPADVLAERSGIAAAFRRLKATEREVLMLTAWDGLSGEEAAEVLGCSPEAFRVRLHRARAALAKHLAEDGHEQPKEDAEVLIPRTQETP